MWKLDSGPFDWSMPEEINRVVTDRLADFLFTPSEDGDLNLKREGVPPEKIYRVGNVMIDSLVRLLPAAMQCSTHRTARTVRPLVIFYRPFNVDNCQTLKDIFATLLEISKELVIRFPGTSSDPPTDCGIRPQHRSASFIGSVAVYRISGLAAPGRCRHHRFWGNPGRNHLPGSTMPDLAQQHGTPGHSHVGYQRDCGDWKEANLGMSYRELMPERQKKEPYLLCGTGTPVNGSPRFCRELLAGCTMKRRPATRWPTNAARTRPLSQRIER